MKTWPFSNSPVPPCYRMQVLEGESILPGQSGPAKFLIYNSETNLWVPNSSSRTLTVYDFDENGPGNKGRNCILDGEHCLVRFQAEDRRFYLVGSFGLIRKAKVVEAGGIADSATGTIDLYSDNAATGIEVELDNDSGSSYALNDVITVRFVSDEGKWRPFETGGGGLTGKKSIIFQLATTALTTSNSQGPATIYYQFGIGTTSTSTGPAAISVKNMLTSSGDYLFEGDVGDYGIAIWDNSDEYQIIQMECP